ncbi:hypothetical protein [Roseovarius sp. 2305UL8-3]|uniref:hypothetical protein n=1 Tax=Roseovarius conchicola TaxID=3121636 RepID=UPI003529ABC7
MIPARLTWLFLIVLGVTGPAIAQDSEYDSCFHLNDHTSFCGKAVGWKLLETQSVPNVTGFINQTFFLSITHQEAHGRSLSSGLYSEVAEGLLLNLDKRMDVPDGSHDALFVDVIAYENIEGRRMGIVSEYGGDRTTTMIDFLISPRHLWVVQTGHVGPIEIERLARAHSLAMKEVRLAP